MRRGEIEPPPVTLEFIDQLPEVTELNKDENGWNLYLKTKQISLPDKNVESAQARKSIELMAKSFSHGSSKNIFFYMEQFVIRTYKDLQQVELLKNTLEKLLLRVSYISISASVYNSGNSPVNIRPYMALSFSNSDLKEYSILLKVEAEKQEQEKTDLKTEISRMEKKSPSGTDVKTRPFLPKSIGSEYTFIPPNSSKVIALSSIKALGEENGKRVLELFKANALSCELILLSGDGKEIHSRSLVFGESISKEDRKLIDDAVARTND